jgi:hypothetical protein
MITAESKREHAAFCRVTIAGNLPHRGAALIRWWFDNLNAGRRERPWTSREVAHQATLPMAVVNQAFREARDEGIVEYTPDGWVWRG